MSPTSLKSRFTTRFLRALTKINAQKPISTSSPREIFLRYRRIKVAADKSMAYSVRSRRAWRRAVVWKLRSRSRRRHQASSIRSLHRAISKRTGHEEGKKSGTIRGSGEEVGLAGQAGELRELVPGGEAMDLCSLLDETAHYIKCLTTQVQVMRKIADFYSL